MPKKLFFWNMVVGVVFLVIVTAYVGLNFLDWQIDKQQRLDNFYSKYCQAYPNETVTLDSRGYWLHCEGVKPEIRLG